MTMVEFNLFDNFNFGPKVSVEIDGELAKTLMQLASDCAFGDNLSLTDLETLVHHLLTNQAEAGKRKRDAMTEAAKEQFAQDDVELQEVRQSSMEKIGGEEAGDSETGK